MSFLQTFATRAFYAVILLLAVLVLNFSMMHMAPGDVADTIAQSMGGADAEILAQIRADYGLDQPFLVQLGRYIGNVLQFDLGYSFFYNQPVTDLILSRLPATLLLRPTGFTTLAVRIWSSANELLYAQAAVSALILLVVSALPMYLIVTRLQEQDR